MTGLLSVNQWTNNFKVPTLNSLNLKHLDFELNLSNALKITGSALVGASAIYFAKIWTSYSFLKKKGIKTPPPKFIHGNTQEIFEKQYSNCLKEWTKKYGKTYGYYEGHLPIIVTSDVEIINEVFVKKFSSNFSARKELVLSQKEHPVHLVDSNKTQWKRMRTVINPTFTPAKLKEMASSFNKCTERLVNLINQNIDKEINVTEFTDCYTMDILWNSVYGMDIDCQYNRDNIYLQKAREHFRYANSPNFFATFNLLFPELKFISFPLAQMATKLFSNMAVPMVWIQQNIFELLNKRMEQKIYKKDFMQLLIDAVDDNVDTSQDDKEYVTSMRLEKKLTLNEVNGNLIAFLLAGFETTSTTLSYSFWVLAQHPEELKKLQDELDSNFGHLNDELSELNYDSVSSLEYMDKFLKEVLRMYPIGNFVINRECTVPTTVKGIEFEPGMVVSVDVLSIHYDQELWGPEDPYVFCPDRHSSDRQRNPVAELSFGYGPRICVGQRFALLELKLSLTKILSRFDVVKGPNTKEKMEYFERISVRQPLNGVNVVFKPRDAKC